MPATVAAARTPLAAACTLGRRPLQCLLLLLLVALFVIVRTTEAGGHDVCRPHELRCAKPFRHRERLRRGWLRPSVALRGGSARNLPHLSGQLAGAIVADGIELTEKRFDESDVGRASAWQCHATCQQAPGCAAYTWTPR